MSKKDETPCPNCGHCPTCGRSNTPSFQPYYPFWPYWTQPYWYSPMWSGGTFTVSSQSNITSGELTGYTGPAFS